MAPSLDSGFIPDLPLVGDEAADPTWDADGIENWSSSSDDDEESVVELDMFPPAVGDIGAGVWTKTRTVRTEPLGVPRVSVSGDTADEQKQWHVQGMASDPKAKTELKIETGPTMGPEPTWTTKSPGPPSCRSSDSDSSLVSIPAIVRLKETPVPLPPTVTGLGALPASVSRQTVPSNLPSTAPPATAPCTPTPVPLPPSVQNAPVSHANGKPSPSSALVIKLPASSQPATTSSTVLRKPEQALSTLPRDKTQSPAPHKATATGVTPSRYPLTIETTKDGRAYTMYHEPGGKLIPSRGALFPTGHHLYADARFPFVCTVRSCRQLLRNLPSLSGHFCAKHRNQTFNDNEDGTLTLVGTYRNPFGTSPGIVISQGPISRSVNTPIEQFLFDQQVKASKRQPEESDACRDSKRRVLPDGSRTTTRLLSHPAEYMLSINTNNFQVLYRADIAAMLMEPRKRDLPDEFLRYHETNAPTTQIFACAIAYIVGYEVAGRAACRAAKGPAARLSELCIMPPRSLNSKPQIAGLFTPRRRCVGCNYFSAMTGKPDCCELRAEASETDSEDRGLRVRTSSVRPLPRAPSLRLSQAALQSKEASSPASSGRETEQTLASRRPVRQSVLNRLQEDKNHTDITESPAQTRNKSPSAQPNEEPQRPIPIQQGQFGAPDYEMEDWEIAPGRVTNEDSSQNIAYSGAFLTSSTPITISPDICFNVLTIRPGQIYNVPVQKDRMQVFSVASGKVRVTMGGKEVQLGPNGAFPVRPSAKCVIENRLYFEAMVHCTTVKDYELV
ncbi:Cupin, RmlC-type [Metarhizium rileyi]|uniref:Cupin, RmlC-type n=1 Tax=Metarhizium rileyi (strain RCEF 4871) TaxID=1649241 RepID=A0A167D0D5_METRR|nr:Cupin, RmlC-type [Metarhizium rileyi RCEF 4871]